VRNRHATARTVNWRQIEVECGGRRSEREIFLGHPDYSPAPAEIMLLDPIPPVVIYQ